MKRLVVLFCVMIIVPLPAVIINGYKYRLGNTILYLLGDFHGANFISDSFVVLGQCNALTKIFERLLSNEKCAFFVECDSTDQDTNENNDVLSTMNTSLKEKCNTSCSFKNEDGLKNQFINTHTMIKGGLFVSQVKDKKKDQLELLLKKLESYFNTEAPYSIFSPRDFMNELQKLKSTTHSKFDSEDQLNDALNNKKDNKKIFTTFVFRKSFIDELTALYNKYRKKLIINFIDEAKKEGKNIIVVMAGGNHIETLRKSMLHNVQTLKEFGSAPNMDELKKEGTIQALTSSGLNDLFVEIDKNELFSYTTWGWIKSKAYEWRKILIPAAITGLGVGYWWLKSRSKPISAAPIHK